MRIKVVSVSSQRHNSKAGAQSNPIHEKKWPSQKPCLCRRPRRPRYRHPKQARRCFDRSHDDNGDHPSKHPNMPVLCAALGKGRPKGLFAYTKTGGLRGQRQPTIFNNFDPGREVRRAAELENLRSEQEAIARPEHKIAIDGVVGRATAGLCQRTAIAVTRNEPCGRSGLQRRGCSVPVLGHAPCVRNRPVLLVRR